MRVLREAERPPQGDWTLETVEFLPDQGKHGSPVAVYPDFFDPVEYGGRIYPRHLLATWTRHDGLEVTMQIRTDPDIGPVALGVSVVSGAGLRTEADYRLPVPTMARHAAQVHGFAGTVPTRLPRRPFDPDEQQQRLKTVATLYQEALSLGEPVTKWVHKGLWEHSEFAVSKSRASHLISEARQAGLLPPTTPGRKHA